jgi:hypothetical protein
MNTGDHIYVDLNAFNSSLTNKNQTLLLAERRNGAFLYDASQYYLTVSRFYLENPKFPVIIPVVDLNAADTDTLIYKVYMEYFSHGQVKVKEQSLIFVADDRTQTKPATVSVSDLTYNKYYWLYNYESFIEIFNTALKSCFAKVVQDNNNIVDASGNLIAVASSSLQADISVAISSFTSHEFVLTARSDCFDDSSVSTALSNNYKKIRVYFNAPLRVLFAGFRTIKTSLLSQDAYRLRLFNFVDNFTKSSTADPRAFISMITDVSSTNTWNPVQSIVFTSGVIPVAQSLIGANQVFNPPIGFQDSGSNSNVSPIITDLQLAFEPNNQYRPYIYYAPSGAYRLIDMTSNSNLSDISVEVFWRDRYGGLHPFELQPFCSVSLKLLFRHKSLGV